MKDHFEAVQGAILGQAIGDAMGSQTEFRKGRPVVDLGPTWSYPIPAFSDDTQMMLAIAEALLSIKPQQVTRYHVEDLKVDSPLDMLMQEISANFVKWDNGDLRWGANNRSPGGTCMSAVNQIRSNGIHNWHLTGAGSYGKGNGGAMRASVIGAYFWRNPMTAFQIGALSSVPTHNNLESLLASGAIAWLVASSIQGTPLTDSVVYLLELCHNYRNVLLSVPTCSDQSVEFAIARFGQAVAARNMPVSQFKRINGNDGKGVEAVAAAIHANIRYSSYKPIITVLANETGDSDSTAAIGGALAGARFGIPFIPKAWQQRVEKSSYLFDVASRVWADSKEPESDTAPMEEAQQSA